MKRAYLRVSHRLLEELLHFPSGCRIVRTSETFMDAIGESGETRFLIEGPDLPPAPDLTHPYLPSEVMFVYEQDKEGRTQLIRIEPA